MDWRLWQRRSRDRELDEEIDSTSPRKPKSGSPRASRPSRPIGQPQGLRQRPAHAGIDPRDLGLGWLERRLP